MTKSYSDAYKAAGVDVTAGYKAVELMKKHVSRTTTAGVLDSIGGFGGLFAPYGWYEEASTCIWYRWCWYKAKACDVTR